MVFFINTHKTVNISKPTVPVEHPRTIIKFYFSFAVGIDKIDVKRGT